MRRNLALVDTAQTQCLHQVVDLAGANPQHIRLLDHRQQCLLTPLARLQQAREVSPLPQFGDLQRYLAHSCLPRPPPVTVAIRLPFRAALVEPGTNLLLRFQFDKHLHHRPHGFLQKVAIQRHIVLA